MFRPNALKARLLAGKRALGCWTVLGAPAVIELLALCGFDFLLLDQEHGFGEPSALLHSLQAMAATPACSSVVRVPSNDPHYLKRVLDAGVEGVMVPNVETAEDARAIVAACRYPPAGRRGSALGSARASDYGIRSADYRQRAAQELLIVCQIESPRAVENVEAIAAVEGVDVMFIGPHDLSDHDGRHHPGKHEHAEDVREPAEPLLAAEPRQLGAPVDGGDHRHQDRRQQDDEAPEDEGMHQSGNEPLQQLPLPEHDLELRLRLARGVLPAVVRDGPRDEAVEERAAPARAQCGPRHQGGERERAYSLAFRSSALIAGTTSWRSPITA